MKINLKLLRTGTYHKDFLIEVGDYKQLADTYYFWRDSFGELSDPYDGIEKIISDYLAIWSTELRKLPDHKTIFIPIDFSDEYIDGFEIKSSGNDFEVVYGMIRDINNLVLRVNENECYTNLAGKHVISHAEFKISKSDFLKSLHLS